MDEFSPLLFIYLEPHKRAHTHTHIFLLNDFSHGVSAVFCTYFEPNTHSSSLRTSVAKDSMLFSGIFVSLTHIFGLNV